MASNSSDSAAALAVLLAKLKAKGITVEEFLAAQSLAATDSSDSVKLVSLQVPEAGTKATSQKKTRPKRGGAEGSSRKRRQPATPQGPVRQSKRTKKAQSPVVAEERPSPKKEEEKLLGSRSIISEVTLDRMFFAETQLVEVINLLIAQNWDHLFREEVLVDENAVREFYSQLNVEEKSGVLSFVFRGEKQAVTVRELARILDAPIHGNSEYIGKGNWPASIAKGDVIPRIGGDPSNVSNQGNALKMDIVNRILHRFVCTTVTPRAQKHQVITFQDFLLVDKLGKGEPISLPKIILQHMKRCTDSDTHGLPYPGLVKKILLDLGIYSPTKEVVLSSVLGKDSLAGIGWEFAKETGWLNTRLNPIIAQPAVSQDVEPPVQQPENPAEEMPAEDVAAGGLAADGLGAILIALQALAGKVELLTERVGNLEVVTEKVLSGNEVEWVKELRSVVKEAEESGKINMTHGTLIREQIVALNKQLRFVGTELMDQLKKMFEG